MINESQFQISRIQTQESICIFSEGLRNCSHNTLRRQSGHHLSSFHPSTFRSCHSNIENRVRQLHCQFCFICEESLEITRHADCRVKGQGRSEEGRGSSGMLSSECDGTLVSPSLCLKSTRTTVHDLIHLSSHRIERWSDNLNLGPELPGHV